MSKSLINNFIESVHGSAKRCLKLVVDETSSTTITSEELREAQEHLPEISYACPYDPLVWALITQVAVALRESS